MPLSLSELFRVSVIHISNHVIPTAPAGTKMMFVAVLGADVIFYMRRPMLS
jgi:hypothetical protein